MIPLEFGSVAIDTNVILYALDRDSSNIKGEIAREILRRSRKFPLRVPLQAAAEAFSILTKKFRWPRSDAGPVIEALLTDIPHALTTLETTRNAMRLSINHDIAFWDALLLSGAAAADCGVLLSEDFQDGRSFDTPDVSRRVAVVDPFAPANLPLLVALGAIEA